MIHLHITREELTRVLADSLEAARIQSDSLTRTNCGEPNCGVCKPNRDLTTEREILHQREEWIVTTAQAYDIPLPREFATYLLAAGYSSTGIRFYDPE